MFNSKQKKVISIGLTVSLLALSLAGCGKQKTTGNEILDDARGTQTYVQQNYTTLAENVKKAGNGLYKSQLRRHGQKDKRNRLASHRHSADGYRGRKLA